MSPRNVGATVRLWTWLGIVLFGLALTVLPAVMTYTHLFGQDVSVRIDRCDPQARFGGNECRGSWTDSDGQRRSTAVWHVGAEDKGRTFKARLGPMGAHTGGLWQDWFAFLLLVPLLGIPWYLLVRWRIDRRWDGAAEGLLNAPEPVLTLIVDRTGARRRNRKDYLRVRFGDPDVPVLAGGDRRRIASVRRAPDGDIAFLIERWRAGQVLVLNAEGQTEAVISHAAHRSRPRIERPDGTLLGEIAKADGYYGSDIRTILTPDGTEIGRFGKLRSRRWALCLSPDHSPVLNDAVLAYLFTTK